MGKKTVEADAAGVIALDDEEVIAAMVEAACGLHVNPSSQTIGGIEARARETFAMIRAYFTIHS